MHGSNVLTDRVLVIDDDANFHRLAEAALAPLGLSAVCVRSSEEANGLLTGSVPLAVILDGLLPGVRGDEFARRLRLRYPKELLPIIFVSAFYRDMKSYRLLTSECGVDLVLHKPIAVDQLQGSLAKILAGKLPAAVRGAGDGGDLDGDGGFSLDLDGIQLGGDVADEADALALMELRSQYLAASKERALEMRVALATLSGPGAADGLRMIGLEGHRFRGSGGSFGFPELSRLGGAIEDLVLQNGALPKSGALRARLAGLVEALAEKVLAFAGSAPLPSRLSDRVLPKVLVVGGAAAGAGAGVAAGTGGVAQAVGAAAAGAAGVGPAVGTGAGGAGTAVDAGGTGRASVFGGIRSIRLVAEVGPALEWAIDSRPDVVFLDLEGEALIAACERFSGAITAPVVVLGGDGSVENRLAAVRAGAVGHVPRPPDGEALLRLASAYMKPQMSARVVIAGEEPARLSELAELLATRGVAVEPCSELVDFIPAMERAAPAMAVLDGSLGSASSLELLEVLRADLRVRDLPIVVMGDDKADRLAALAAGAADWIDRSTDFSECEERLMAPLLRRERNVRAAVEPLTGLAHRRALLEALDRALLLGRREGRTLALLGIDARLADLAKTSGRMAADEALMSIGARLTRTFRTSDVVARVGSWGFVALLHGAMRDDAQRLLDIELAELGRQSFGAGWSPKPVGGLVVFPEMTGTAEELLQELEDDLASR